MSTHEFLARVDDLIHKQGWSEETVLDLALDFIGDKIDRQEAFLDFLQEVRDREIQESLPDDADDCPLDGDHESALASAGFGTDEDYGDYGGGGSDWDLGDLD